MKDATILRKTISKLAVSKKCQEKAQQLCNLRAEKKERKLEESKFAGIPASQIIEIESDDDEVVESHPNYMRNASSYNEIPEVPIYEPTAEEFANPLRLIEILNEKGFAKYGCVKIRPPKSWKPEFSFNPSNKKLNVREQLLSNLNEGKSFIENTNMYTLEEFKEMADNFAKNYEQKSPFKFKNSFRANEYEYWAMVEDPEFKKDSVTVEYAADLPSSKYGSGFPSSNSGHPFYLNNLSNSKDSLFQIITRKQEAISGISSPWMYSGMLFASFCWHVEDLYMYSTNYMHKGAAKTWYCIPGDYKEAFDNIIKEKFGVLFFKEPSLLYSIVLTMNPLELVKRKIPVYRTEQKAGELIITFPQVYHAGFSHGFNVSEAVNIAMPAWIPNAKQATSDYARDGSFKKCTFPYEWLIFENIRKINQLKFSREARDQLINAYKEMKDKELGNREKVMKCYDKVLVKPFNNPHIRYDYHTCSTCSNYTYLSFISCMTCKKAGCTHHITVCNCLNTKMVLNTRFTEKELTETFIEIEEDENTDDGDSEQ